MDYGLIGEKLGHSYSPQIHAALADYDYQLCPMPPERVDAFMKAKEFRGINVTIPYKKTVLPYCDELSPDAAEIQCVNTIVKRADGTLFGHNTDVGGFMAMLHHAGIEAKGKKAVILGSGGTSLTATVALRRMEAKEIVVISRSGAENYDTLYLNHQDAQLLVNTTPVGMYPKNGESPVDLGKLPHVQSVVDVIYNPEKTSLIQQAERLGLKTVSGLYMLVAQARMAAELFTGKAISPSIDEKIVNQLKCETLNLVLIGMPGCGKSSLGKLIAEKMQRPLIDTDAEIERLAGKTIPDIFAQDGEDHFRRLESQVIREVCCGHGAVVTTGGGAILKEENRLMMHQNSRVCLIQRPLEKLARNGRPLSAGDGAVERLWNERKALYVQAADYVIENNAMLSDAAQKVQEGFYEAIGD